MKTAGSTHTRHLQILATTRLPGPAFDDLRRRHSVRVYEDVVELVRDDATYCAAVDVVLTWGGAGHFGRGLMDAFRALGLIGTYGVGIDHLDLDAARSRAITVVTTKGAVERPTAEVAVGLMLAVRRRLVEGHELLKRGGWPSGGVEAMLGSSLAGATLGIVGLGRIGHQVGRVAQALEMEIIYAQRRRVDPSVERSLRARFVSMEDLLALADVVTLHCPLTAETHHLIDARALGRMKPTGVLINTSRGAVVDEVALVAALSAHRIGGAGLDVFEAEPIVHPGLLSLPNVVLSPHLGSATVEARHLMTRQLASAVEEYAAGVRPTNALVMEDPGRSLAL